MSHSGCRLYLAKVIAFQPKTITAAGVPPAYIMVLRSEVSAEEVDDGADGGEGVALGRGEADIECGFELIAELDQVERVPSKVSNKGGVETNLRRRKVEVPRNDGLDACLNGTFHLPSSLTLKCQGNVNG